MNTSNKTPQALPQINPVNTDSYKHYNKIIKYIFLQQCQDIVNFCL